MAFVNRRNFLKASGVAVLPVVVPAVPALASGFRKEIPGPVPVIIKLFGDGEMFEPGDYLEHLQQLHTASPIGRDRYGTGGAVESLEKKFAEITGKEKAVYMPSGTMANQFAIHVLSGENTKVVVQETSHVFRDEADAAQSVFQKRLIPLAKDRTGFTADELRQTVEGLQQQEAFTSRIGVVSVENPVRRADGRALPLDEIKKISGYCRNNQIKLHLDGARIYMAAAWYGIPVKEYASLFDTVYISLYKYLGASAGAILCGDSNVIAKMPHLIKIHGGNMFSSWTNAAMAMHRLEGLETRLQEARKRGEEIIAALNKLNGIRVSPLENGTNIYQVQLDKTVDGKKMQQTLNKEFSIRMVPPDDQNKTTLTVNETILYREPGYVINAFTRSLQG